MVGAEAGIDESIFAGLRHIHRKLALRRADGKFFGGRMCRAFFAEGGIVRRPNSRGVPNAAGSIEHRIVRDRPAVPDSFLSPVGRGPKYRVVVSRRRIGVTCRSLECG